VIQAALIAVVLCAPAPSAAVRKADKLVQEATVDYNASDFDAALRKLTEAYKLKSDPALLFDIAQCYRALHQWERAEFTYKAYLKERPDARDRKKVKALIAKVHAERDQAAAAEAAKQQAAAEEAARQKEKEEAEKARAEAAPPPAPPAPAPEPAPAAATTEPAATVTAEAAPHRRIPVVTWVLGGVGAAALLGGGYFGFADNQITSQNHPTTGSDGQPLNTITYSQFQSSQNDAAIADTLFIGGGVLLITAVIWAFVAPTHGGAKAAPHPTPNGVPF
jgi:tetratricopeptide (TPR) repeat protein